MPSEFINLLPSDRLRAFNNAYRIRLLTVALFALVIIVAVHVGMLAPSYFYLRDQIVTRENELAQIDMRLAASGEGTAQAELTRLTAEAQELVRLKNVSLGSDVISAVLAILPEGIVLTSFSFEGAQGETPGRLALSGTASDRETLRAFVLALDALPFVDRAELPLGAYAKETDIIFTITLVGPLKP